MAGKKSGEVSLSSVYQFIQETDLRNEMAHGEIKLEIQKNRNDVGERMSEIKERLVKIETQPAHENFQQRFCPNTVAIAGIGSQLDVHIVEYKEMYKKINKLLEKFDTYEDSFELKTKALVDMYEGKIEQRDIRARKAMYASLIAFIVIAVPVIIDLGLHVFG